MDELGGLSDEELNRAKLLGAATYVSAYLRQMARAIGAEVDDEGLNVMVVELIDTLNAATMAMWGAVVGDELVMRRGQDEFKRELEKVLERK